MDEYLCLTLASEAGEPEATFKARLVRFWTHMLRTKPDDYAKVYAEATEFESEGDAVTRKYLVEAGVAGVLAAELAAAAVAFRPLDATDLYTKYEATPPDWFWIEH